MLKISIGRDSVGGEVAKVVGEYHPLAGLILYNIIVLLHVKEHVLQSGRCGMDRFMLDHLQGLMVVLDNYMSTI